jgi:hypothetical protein
MPEAEAPVAPSQEQFEVDRPGGGKLTLIGAEEVEVWERLRDKYIRDYSLSKANDLALLGAILSQHLIIFRAEQRLNGMEPELDHGKVPTGRYKHNPPSAADVTAAQKAIGTGAKEIRELESSLGIDKKTREAGGQHTVGDYVTKLKKAAHQFGVHLSKRLLAYEEFCMELKWKLRSLKNCDAEDLQKLDLSPDKVLEWAEKELAKIEQMDKEFAKDKGKLFLGSM